MTIHLLVCRGIGERVGANLIIGDGLGPGVIDRLPDGEAFHTTEIHWPATYGPVGASINGVSYGRALDTGMEQIAAALRNLPDGDTAILLGYSAGATLAGNYARYAKPGVHYRERIVGVGLIADPMQPMHVTPGSGHGIGGVRPIPDDDFPVWWISNPRDAICCCPADSPLRTVADQTYAMSFSSGGAPLWVADLADRLVAKRWQAVKVEWWNPVKVFRQYAAAIEGAYGYLLGGEHTMYDQGGAYSEPLTQALAYNIIDRARELGEL